MRRPGHIRQRSSGSFELRYSLGTDPATGKRRVAASTVKGNHRAAEKELRRLLRTLDTGEHVDPSRITVCEWLTTWLTAVREEVAPKSHERYAEIVRNFLAPALGNMPLHKLAPSHIQEAYNAWNGGLARRQKRRPLLAQPAFGNVGIAMSHSLLAPRVIARAMPSFVLTNVGSSSTRYSAAERIR
jgi:Phage integrase, N-terminal SAM-like domain